MMRVTSAIRALPTTFALYALGALLAVFGALPLSLELADARDVGSAAWDASRSAAFLEGLLERSAAGRSGIVSLGLSLATSLLLGPLLHMSWLAALDAPVTLGAALGRGAARAGRAALVSLVVGAAGLGACAVLGGLVYLLHGALETASARTHDLTLLVAAMPVLGAALLVHVWHDLARAHALTQGVRTSVQQALPLTVRPRFFLRGLALSAVGLGLVVAAESAVALLPSSAFTALGSVVVLQSALLARYVLRSLWLTCTLSAAASRAREE